MATPPSSSWAGEKCICIFGKNWEKLLCAVLLTCALERHLEFITRRPNLLTTVLDKEPDLQAILYQA